MSEADTLRMTPAKMLLLIRKRESDLAARELPIACFQALYYNMNRSPGDPEKGIPAADPLAPKDFLVFGHNRKRTLAAKDDYGPGGKHVLYGARADRDRWEAWAGSKVQPQVKE